MEVMCSSGELSVAVGGCLAHHPARVQRGTRNGDGNAGSQSGPTAIGTCTQAPLTDILKHLQGIQLTGQGVMSCGPEWVWGGAKPNLTTQVLLGTAEDSAKNS